MTMTWQTTKVRKMGTSARTDSFTPRRFITVRMAMPATSIGIFRFCQCSGSRLKIWSPPEAMEVVMVRT